MQSVLIILISLLFLFRHSSSQQLDCPDLCDYLVIYNITETRSESAAVTASRFCDPDNAGFGWHSAAYAPQYIQLDLTEKCRVSCVHLKVCMTPHGQTHHTLWAGDTLNHLRVVKELINETAPNRAWLNLTFNPPLDEVRFLHLTTTASQPIMDSLGEVSGLWEVKANYSNCYTCNYCLLSYSENKFFLDYEKSSYTEKK